LIFVFILTLGAPLGITRALSGDHYLIDLAFTFRNSPFGFLAIERAEMHALSIRTIYFRDVCEKFEKNVFIDVYVFNYIIYCINMLM
jgi:hypothetical protein